MDKKDISNSIEISSKLDDYILKGIEKGRNEKQLIKKRNNMNRIAKVSCVLIASVVGMGVINPEIVRAIPILGRALDVFDSSTFGRPTEKYVNLGKETELVVEDKNVKVTLSDVIVDENICMLGLIIESDALKGFKGKNQSDFINIDSDITLNGEVVDGIGHKAIKIDDRTGAIVLSANTSDLKLDNNVKVNLKISNIRGEKEVSGNWDFKVKVNKVKDSKRISINKSHNIKGQHLVVDEVVTSPFLNTIIISGKDDTEKEILFGAKYKVMDDEGNNLRTEMGNSSLSTDTGEFDGKIEVFGDLSNTKYIELIPYWGSDNIDKEIDGINYNLLTTTGVGEREENIISRKPTSEELKNGYALSKVNYYLNLDKESEFLTVDDLRGYEIEVNNKDKVLIKDIEINEESTKITMKIIGDYNYRNLNQLVLFDEEMNDTSIWEGHIGTVIEDEKEGIYSITLDKIDKSKKYKLAVPMTKDIDLDSKYKVKINLD